MTHTLHASDVAVPPVDALTSGVGTDDEVLITGQLAFDAAVGGIPDGATAVDQAEVVMARIEALLAAEGLGFDSLVHVRIYVTDLDDVLPVNAVYARFVRPPYPARVTIGVAFLALPGAKVEIEAVARRAARRTDDLAR
jgi:2-iminobutanoate/2-iminopropanoate deaminase